MIFENGMTCEIIISNGTFTFGYVNGKPAEWVGNNERLTDGVDFRLINEEGSTIIFSKQRFKAYWEQWPRILTRPVENCLLSQM